MYTVQEWSDLDLYCRPDLSVQTVRVIVTYINSVLHVLLHACAQGPKWPTTVRVIVIYICITCRVACMCSRTKLTNSIWIKFPKLHNIFELRESFIIIIFCLH